MSTYFFLFYLYDEKRKKMYYIEIEWTMFDFFILSHYVVATHSYAIRTLKKITLNG